MGGLLSLQQKIIPEMVELMDKRYCILKKIFYNQPIGRRALSQALNMGERTVRTEVNFLKNQGLIEINSIGMIVTKDGENIIENLEEMIHEINGLSDIEKKLKNVLNLEEAIVVPGDAEKDDTVLREMGRVAANRIKDLIKDNSIIALTGGSSVAQVVQNFPKINKNNVLVVPARGGMGRDIKTQASTLAAELAFKIGANYKLLHVPDNLSNEAIETIANEPDILDTIEKISKADLLVYGIGRASDMSKRRGMNEHEIEMLKKSGAVSEAFGYYFNKDGKIVYKTPTIGLNFEDIGNINNIIAVAGGKNKAEAIISTKTSNNSLILVTDEGAANAILKIKC